MGPRSDNRGYGCRVDRILARRPFGWRLQWVHGPITVVMKVLIAEGGRDGGFAAGLAASMGPRSDNRVVMAWK